MLNSLDYEKFNSTDGLFYNLIPFLDRVAAFGNEKIIESVLTHSCKLTLMDKNFVLIVKSALKNNTGRGLLVFILTNLFYLYSFFF